MTKEEEIDQFCRIAKTKKEFAPKTLAEAYIMGMEDGRHEYMGFSLLGQFMAYLKNKKAKALNAINSKTI